MRKHILIIAAAIVTTLGVGFAANSIHKIADHSKCEAGMKCTFCDGTGWQKGTSFKCSLCKGTGSNNSY
jgi:hypothetical protein